MRRFVTLVVLLLFAIPFGVSISGCSKTVAPTFCNGGDSGIATGQATNILLTPLVYGISLNYAEIGQISSPATTDCKGSTVFVRGYTYGTTNMQIADVQPSTGRICAGTWNRNSGGGIPDFTYCTPTNITGTAYISASANGVTSNPLPIFVHPVVTSIVLGGASQNCTTDPTTACCPLATTGQVTAQPYLPTSCVSQGQTAQLVARVYAGLPFTGVTTLGSNQITSVPSVTGLAVGQTVNSAAFPSGTTIAGISGTSPYTVTVSTNATATNTTPIAINNISCQAGHLQYSVQGATSLTQVSSVVSIDQNGVATAQQPGSVLISANLANAASSAGIFSTCPPTSISLTPAGVTGSPVVVNENNQQSLTAIATDQNNVVLNGLALEYVSTSPSTIGASETLKPTLAGAAQITAVCQPPNCNQAAYNQIGLFGNGKPVTSNSVNVTTPGTNSTVLYMASTQSTSVVQVDFTTGVVGAPFVLPFVPNSMFISNDGVSIYLGSSTALMVLTINDSLALSRTDITSPGTILALSPDGSTLVISDPIHQLIELESTSGGVETTYGGVGTHAEFSPDGQTVYIAAGNQVLVFSGSTGWTSYSNGPIPPATITPATPAGTPVTDVAVMSPSVGAYFAGPTTTARGYCAASTPVPGQAGNETNFFFPPADNSAAVTDRIAATGDGLHILGATVTGGATLRDLKVAIAGVTPTTTPGTTPVVACPASGAGLQFMSTYTSVPLAVAATAITGVLVAEPVYSSIPSTLYPRVAFVTYTGTGGVLPAYAPQTGTITPVPLVKAANAASPTAPVAGVLSADNTVLYVGTSGDNLVHIINRGTLTDCASQPAGLCGLGSLIPSFLNPNLGAPVNLIVQKPRKTT
jgi:hypothetical protein